MANIFAEKELIYKLYASYNLYRMVVDEEMQFITYLKLLDYSELEAKDIITYLCMSGSLGGFAKLAAKLPMV